jgi:hypothetical protein
MATAAPAFEDRRMSIGRVFQRAFAAIRLNPVVILLLALFVGALPGLVVTYFFVETGMMTPGTVPTAATFNRLMGAGVVVWVISLIFSALVQGALTRATVSANEGRASPSGRACRLPYVLFYR